MKFFRNLIRFLSGDWSPRQDDGDMAEGYTLALEDHYVRALESVVRAAGAWHDSVIMGRFDDIPNKHNATLTEVTGFINKWPTQYKRIMRSG